jgi:hypothetical protein
MPLIELTECLPVARLIFKLYASETERRLVAARAKIQLQDQIMAMKAQKDIRERLKQEYSKK